MSVQVKESNHLENILLETCYSGQRFILKGQNGAFAAVVPLEDLEILEELERTDVLQFAR